MGTYLVGVFLKHTFYSHVEFYLFDRVDETPLQQLRCLGKVKDLLFGTEFPNGEENQQKDMKIYKLFFLNCISNLFLTMYDMQFYK